ncbi:hypothetical protein, partial [Leifsonia sp. SIMBA_070]|uniref:hypothetical protein n=1 Tax=Leifsonia sp. SIMBA_070 TaxID=3085810 RepID=UPI00397C6D4A
EHGNGDSKKPFRLTPGEFVLRKEVVKAVGKENISRLSSGVATWQDMLLSGAQRSLDGQSSTISTGGAQGLQALVGGQSLQGSLPRVGTLSGMRVSNFGGSTTNRAEDN